MHNMYSDYDFAWYVHKDIFAYVYIHSEKQEFMFRITSLKLSARWVAYIFTLAKPISAID